MGASKTIDEWEKAIEKMGDMELCDVNESLSHLKKWAAFDEAFRWTGYGVVGQLVLEEMKRRHLKAEKVVVIKTFQGLVGSVENLPEGLSYRVVEEGA